MQILSVAIAIVFSGLSLLHFYWALGGRFAADKVIPESDGRPMFQAGGWVTIVVAIGLGCCAVLVWTLGFHETGTLRFGNIVFYAAYVLAGIFFLRAIGDFRFVGFFKRVRGTEFAKYDSLLYSPLCLILSIGIALLALLRHQVL